MKKGVGKARARRSFRRKLAFKKTKWRKNKLRLGRSRLSKKQRYYKNQYLEKYSGYKRIKAPANFSLIKNPELVIEFISKLRAAYESEQEVFVVLRDVTKIDYDAIVVLLSIVVRFKSQNIGLVGDFPSDYTANKTLTESGFFKNLWRNTFEESDRYNIKQTQNLSHDNIIHTHAWKNVDSELSATIIQKASETVWGSLRRCQGAQRTLIELMLNTNNHAVIGKEGERHWWLSVNHQRHENKVSFSFIDYGVGVFTSLNNKKDGSKFHNAINKMLSLFSFQSNAQLLKLILEGELHRTVTNEHYRGKGLPGIYEALKRNSFSNLFIITNDVYADVSRGVFREIRNNFTGTFLYFELEKSNLSCDGTN